MKPHFLRALGSFLGLLTGALPAGAWDYEGHRAVNQLALASVHTNFPAFALTPAAQERIAFLGGEPDRWRNTTDLPLKHHNGPDHYIDIEDLALIGAEPKTLSHFRYEFVAQVALARAAAPAHFPPIDAAKDADKTRALIGFLPWAITEQYAKLKSAFSYWKTFEPDGAPEEVANAQQNVIYLMGVLGHFVGDATQPLHTTQQYNGWVGENPRRYTTRRTFHAWIDGGYFIKTGGLKISELRARLRPAKLLWPGSPEAKHDDVFPETIDFILEQFKQVEPLYQIDKEGKLSGEGPLGLQGGEFLSSQLVKAGQMLGDLWYSAWQQAPLDNYLKTQLAKRKPANPIK
jgi:hypothetical protein